MNKIGVMQGRLLPKYQGRYQAHPVGYWQDEFALAKELGLDCIEFILDYNDVEDNPLLKRGGIDEIKAIVEKTGVNVHTICADYLMEAPLHSEDSNVANFSQQLMVRLLNSAVELGVIDVVIPCVDQSSLSNQAAIGRFVTALTPLVKIAENNCINLSLETDLAPQTFAELLDRFNSKHVTVNYDIGNSAARGYSLAEEIDAYGEKISDIHIKDRVLNGGSVVLGEGCANFELFFNKLQEINYKGPIIMQAYRDDEGVEIFKQQFSWVKSYLRKHS